MDSPAKSREKHGQNSDPSLALGQGLWLSENVNAGGSGDAFRQTSKEVISPYAGQDLFTRQGQQGLGLSDIASAWNDSSHSPLCKPF